MFRLNKLADYALVVMEYIASRPEEELHTARSLADATHLPMPTVVKLLKKLSDRDLLVSHRGVKGGYTLPRHANAISLVEVIEAIEGPLGFTQCATRPGQCELEGICRLQNNFGVIGRVIRQTLSSINLSDLTRLLNVAAKVPTHGNVLTSITLRTQSSGGMR